MVLCHQGLSDRARQKAGDKPVLVFNAYLGDPVFKKLEEDIANDNTIEG